METIFAVPAHERSLKTMLSNRASAHPDREFLVIGERSWTYAEFDAWVSRLARGLSQIGVRSGDKVIIMLPNCIEFVGVWFACARIGAVEVPVNTGYKGLLLEHIVSNSDATVAVVAGDYLDRFELERPPFDALDSVLVCGGVDAEQSVDAHPRVRPFSVLEADGTEPVAPPQPAHTAALAILYSSGTTGPSKGIIVNHNYFWFGGARLAAYASIGPKERLYTCLPLFHANAQLLTVMPALVAGATAVIDERFSASKFWSRIRATGATRFNYIGGMIPILMKQPTSVGDRDHAVTFALGAAAPREQFRDFETRFGVRLLESYGQTENGVALSNPVDAVRVGSMGVANCGYDVRVVDEADEPVAPHETGELVFRPQYPNIMMDGYYAMPEETLAASRNLWFHSGDLVFHDEDGYFYFVDRKKDAMRRRGENISAYEVEMVLNSHPAVLESAAFALPSDVGEDEVMVSVVLRPGQQLDPLDLVKHCSERMAYFSVPRFVDIKDELPKTPTHRVEKYRLRAQGLTNTTWDRELSGYQLPR